jgi:hypothetical protein
VRTVRSPKKSVSIYIFFECVRYAVQKNQFQCTFFLSAYGTQPKKISFNIHFFGLRTVRSPQKSVSIYIFFECVRYAVQKNQFQCTFFLSAYGTQPKKISFNIHFFGLRTVRSPKKSVSIYIFLDCVPYAAHKNQFQYTFFWSAYGTQSTKISFNIHFFLVRTVRSPKKSVSINIFFECVRYAIKVDVVAYIIWI